MSYEEVVDWIHPKSQVLGGREGRGERLGVQRHKRAGTDGSVARTQQGLSDGMHTRHRSQSQMLRPSMLLDTHIHVADCVVDVVNGKAEAGGTLS